ncbi:flagellar biosynthetic protein FliQ [Thaumasiovibrio sp. DFM-14]|uniref:flagellar biosynthetic protein FliQ n=1 Tax=Thaumasiovibrio sp. DFM-14 TaxID=3384792 RepID=UPI00399F9EBC
MGVETTVNLYAEAIYLVITLVVVLIAPSLVVGLVVAVFQATTQINEQTMSFLPRLLTTLAVLVITGPWLLRNITDLFNLLFNIIPTLVR